MSVYRKVRVWLGSVFADFYQSDLGQCRQIICYYLAIDNLFNAK